jgi:hypothetical protein
MGRTKGSLNKRTFQLKEHIKSLGCDPLDVLVLFAKGDWRALGYESATVTKVTAQGEVIQVERITTDNRIAAAKEAAQYIYAKLRSIEVSDPEGNPVGFIGNKEELEQEIAREIRELRQLSDRPADEARESSEAEHSGE